ncbi:MAG: sodium:solute symporter [Bacteroidota bacterium]
MLTRLGPWVIFSIIVAYFLVLIALSWWTNRKGDSQDFYLAGRKSPWFLVAFGMVGTSLSGVTFISVPGLVGKLDAQDIPQAFSYMQVVIGYLIGYLVIATVLLPLYYKRNLTSIYQYLDQRLGLSAYKVGAFYFLVSRVLGAALRLFLVALVLDQFVTGPLGVPFAVTVAVTIILIWVYTHKGGIKTIVYTDTLQTAAMIAALLGAIWAISQSLNSSLGDLWTQAKLQNYDRVFFFEGGWSDPRNFFKQVISGALITITMTGLDQDMMQKNLSIAKLRDAQKNMAVFSIILLIVNGLFLFLGALLYLQASQTGMELPASSDLLFPTSALGALPVTVGVLFIIGLIAAAYSSADSALTALTTSFCVDFLDFGKKGRSLEEQVKTRRWVHVGFSALLFTVILITKAITEDTSVIYAVLKVAGFTYGPLLGLFCFGLFTDLKAREWVQLGSLRIPMLVLVCLAAPIISFIVDYNSAEWFNGFEFGFTIMAFNGLLTFVGLLLLSYSEVEEG